MNKYDLIIFVIIAMGFLYGYIRGFFAILIPTISLVLSYFVKFPIYSALVQLDMQNIIGNWLSSYMNQGMTNIIGLATSYVLAKALLNTISYILGYILIRCGLQLFAGGLFRGGNNILGKMDKIIGGVIGAAVMCIIVYIGLVITHQLSDIRLEELRQSFIFNQLFK